MSINDNGTRDQFTATGGQTIFPYTFEIFDKDDIAVEQNGILLAEGTNYTVSGVDNDNGGNVTLIVGATAGDILTLYRAMALDRLNDFQESGDFLADEVNEDYDRLWAGLQQIETTANVGIRPTVDDPALNSTNTELANVATRGGKILGFTSTGLLSYFSTAESTASLIDTPTTATMTALSGLVAGVSVVITAEFSTGNGGGGTYDIISGTGTANGFDIIAHNTESLSFVLRIEGTLFVKSVGVKETGDQLAALDRIVEITKGTGILIDFEEQMTLATTGQWNLKGNFIKITGRSTEIKCSGSAGDYAIAIDPDGGIYPVSCYIIDLIGVAENSSCAGAWDIRCSSSTLTIQGQIKFNNQIVFNLEGDVNGTGPYYNVFLNCRGQGNAFTASTNQSGWLYGFDASTPTRGPNANTHVGGRVGQCDTNYTILGTGNTLFMPTSEGAENQHFLFQHPSEALGCTGNSVKGCYIEGSASANPDGFVVGSNSISTDIEATFVTSIGSGTLFSDVGADTRFITAGEMSLPSKGMVISQEGITEYPQVSGQLAAWSLNNPIAGEDLVLQNNSNSSTSASFFRLLDNAGGGTTLFEWGTASTAPGADNTVNLGTASKRWKEVFAGNATINTSDERYKTELLPIDDTERLVAIDLKKALKKFKFKDAEKDKGVNARIHFGIGAQTVASIFKSHGLDASKYALFCYDKWEEEIEEIPATKDKDGNVIKEAYTVKRTEAGNRYGIRYPQLLAFIISAM